MEIQNVEQLSEVWKTEQEILDVFVQVCKDNGLQYSLAYGTLLGAVRHKGFIPWDDDIDVIMPRDDYNKLLQIWSFVAPKGYLLQNSKTNPDFDQNMTKIRKDHTTFLQFECERLTNYHKGCFIDIFPGDRVAPTNISRHIQFIASAISLLYTRKYTSGSGGLIGFTEKMLIKIPDRLKAKLLQCSNKIVSKWNSNKKAKWFFPNTIRDAKIYYNAALFDHLIESEFNGKSYSVINGYHECLTKEYGDYMQLPPESERVWTHHPIIIDFEHNYEELNNE